MLLCAHPNRRSAYNSVAAESKGVPVPGLAPLRKQAGLSQEELAARSGVGRATISRLEQGGRGYYDTIDKLAKALRVSRKRLLGTSAVNRERQDPTEEST
jgi:transcriptional regulator with XRE-family HTH domain